MKTILWLLTTTRDTPKTIDHVIRQAGAKGAKVDVFFVLDQLLGEEVFKRLAQESFVGGGPSRDLAASLLQDYGERGKLKFGDLTKRMEEAKIEVSTCICEGCTVEECIKKIGEAKPVEIVLTKMSGSRLSRFVLETALDKIQAFATCPVTVIEEA